MARSKKKLKSVVKENAINLENNQEVLMSGATKETLTRDFSNELNDIQEYDINGVSFFVSSFPHVAENAENTQNTHEKDTIADDNQQIEFRAFKAAPIPTETTNENDNVPDEFIQPLNNANTSELEIINAEKELVTLLKKADSLLDQRKYKKAISDYLEIIKYVKNLSEKKYTGEDYNLSISYVNDLHRLADIHFNLALAYVRNGEKELALNNFIQAKKQYNESAELIKKIKQVKKDKGFNLNKNSEKNKEFQEMIKELKKEISITDGEIKKIKVDLSKTNNVKITKRGRKRKIIENDDAEISSSSSTTSHTDARDSIVNLNKDSDFIEAVTQLNPPANPISFANSNSNPGHVFSDDNSLFIPSEKQELNKESGNNKINEADLKDRLDKIAKDIQNPPNDAKLKYFDQIKDNLFKIIDTINKIKEEEILPKEIVAKLSIMAVESKRFLYSTMGDCAFDNRQFQMAIINYKKAIDECKFNLDEKYKTISSQETIYYLDDLMLLGDTYFNLGCGYWEKATKEQESYGKSKENFTEALTTYKACLKVYDKINIKDAQTKSKILQDIASTENEISKIESKSAKNNNINLAAKSTSSTTAMESFSTAISRERFQQAPINSNSNFIQNSFTSNISVESRYFSGSNSPSSYMSHLGLFKAPTPTPVLAPSVVPHVLTLSSDEAERVRTNSSRRQAVISYHNKQLEAQLKDQLEKIKNNLTDTDNTLKNVGKIISLIEILGEKMDDIPKEEIKLTNILNNAKETFKNCINENENLKNIQLTSSDLEKYAKLLCDTNYLLVNVKSMYAHLEKYKYKIEAILRKAELIKSIEEITQNNFLFIASMSHMGVNVNCPNLDMKSLDTKSAEELQLTQKQALGLNQYLHNYYQTLLAGQQTILPAIVVNSGEMDPNDRGSFAP